MAINETASKDQLGRVMIFPVSDVKADTVMLVDDRGNSRKFLPYLPKLRIYTAGGIDVIDGRAVDSYTNWRTWAKTDFDGKAVILNPCDKPEMPADFTPNEMAKHIVLSDLDMIASSDLVLMEYQLPNRQYEGTMMELAFAYAIGKPVVMFSQHVYNDPARKHPWIRFHTTHIVPTYVMAVDLINKEYING